MSNNDQFKLPRITPNLRVMAMYVRIKCISYVFILCRVTHMYLIIKHLVQ